MERKIEQLLLEYLEFFRSVAVIGPRQCGKMTLLHTLDDTWEHFDLEKGSDIEQILADPDLFLRLNSEKITIDEAQLLPSLFNALRVSIDGDRSKKGRFIVTGPSSPELISSITESLAGRVGILEMSPFAFSEFSLEQNHHFYDLLLEKKMDTSLDIKNFIVQGDLASLHSFWLKGGYPEPWLARDKKRFHSSWMSNYVTSL